MNIPKNTVVVNSLPAQGKFFETAGLKRAARAGTQLPDPTNAPYGYDPNAQFKHLFPALELPILKPPASHHPEDRVSFGSAELPPHELYLGDNLYLLRQLPSDFIDLIYIDPPFFSNRTYTQIWGDDNEVRSFNDIFQDGMFSYLAWLNARLWEMKRVLKPSGSIYVHCDWHASHYIKCELDKIFGYDHLRNEIVWHYRRWSAASNNFQRMHDMILWYSKTEDYIFTKPLQPYSKPEWIEDTVRGFVDGKLVRLKDKDGNFLKRGKANEGVLMHDVWEDINFIGPTASERLGYPTQKPVALLQRIIESSSRPGDIVADFFMGGGTTGAVAFGQRSYRNLKVVRKRNGEAEEKEELIYCNGGEPRRFIGCDISRVAVSVSASRLIEIGEEISGIVVSSDKKANLGLKFKAFADIQIGYVGSYPIEKFKGISQDEFVKFVLTLYQAGAFTGKSTWIHGLANGKLLISVGPADPSVKVPMSQVKELVEEVLRQYKLQLTTGEERILQVIGWGFNPAIEIWKGQAVSALNKENIKIRIELVSLGSEAFRQKIFRYIGESNIDLKFNRLNQLLSFTSSPYAGTIKVNSQKGLSFTFQLEGAKAIGTGRLINCQWDFSHDGKRFASREHALNREKKGQGDFEAVLQVEHTFSRPGEYNIAARVQDNLDGEAIIAAQLIVKNGSHQITH